MGAPTYTEETSSKEETPWDRAMRLAKERKERADRARDREKRHKERSPSNTAEKKASKSSRHKHHTSDRSRRSRSRSPRPQRSNRGDENGRSRTPPSRSSSPSPPTAPANSQPTQPVQPVLGEQDLRRKLLQELEDLERKIAEKRTRKPSPDPSDEPQKPSEDPQSPAVNVESIKERKQRRAKEALEVPKGGSVNPRDELLRELEGLENQLRKQQQSLKPSLSVMDCTTPLTQCDIMPSSDLTSGANADPVPFVETGFASTGFLIMCSALVFIMTPAVVCCIVNASVFLLCTRFCGLYVPRLSLRGMFYSGFSRSQHSLSIILICCMSYAVVSVQWVIWGYSLGFSETSRSPFIGNLDFAGLEDLTWQGLKLTAPAVPAIAFALYQLQFATVTVSLIFGSVIERVRIAPVLVFMFVWSTCIYDPIAYWTWSARGWIRNMSCLSTIDTDSPCQIGGLDFAGGGPVHMSSGAAALAFCIFLGRRKNTEGVDEDFKAHSVTSIFLGTALLWMGWFGFNAGSALSATPRAANAALVTTVAASSGAIAWNVADFLITGKFSGIAFCSGAIAGLVGITPASGFVNAWSGLLIGAITAVCCLFAIRIKNRFGYDDAADVWGVHGVGGFVGNVCTGLFAKKSIAALDGTVIAGGAFFDRDGYLLGYNLAGSLATLSYSFVGTMIILYAINKIPGLRFRLSENEEIKGSDIANMGEEAYPNSRSKNSIRRPRLSLDDNSQTGLTPYRTASYMEQAV